MKYILLSVVLLTGCATPQYTRCHPKPLKPIERIAQLEEKLDRLERLEKRVNDIDNWNFDVYLDQENRIRKLEHRKPVGVEETEGKRK